MVLKSKAAKTGLRAVKAAPAKGGLKLRRRKVERTPAGTAVLYGQALVGNEGARDELRDAYRSARGPAIAVIAVAGAGTAFAVSKKKSADASPETSEINGVPAGAH